MITDKLIIKTIQEKDAFFSFFILEEFSPKNDDQEYFGIVEVSTYKTWAFFSQSQINELAKDFKLKSITTATSVSDVFKSVAGFHVNYNKALKERFFFNLSLIYMFIEEDHKLPPKGSYFSFRKESFSKYKKYPLLNLALDDKQEIFYKKKNVYSFRKAKDFRFPQFNSEFAKTVSKASSLNELVTNITKIDSGCREHVVFKKLIRANLVINTKHSLEIDFFFLALIQQLAQIFDTKILTSFAESGLITKLTDKKNFREFHNCFLINNKTAKDFFEIVSFFYKYDSKWCVNSLANWNLAVEFTQDFWKYITELEQLEMSVRYNKYANINYLFHTLSKNYTKLKTPNFKLGNGDLSKSKIDKLCFNDKYDLLLADDYETLVKWGTYLHNCAGNFEQIDEYKETISIGLINRDTGKIEYLASIKENKLTQLKGFKNSAPSKEFFVNFVSFLVQMNIIPKEPLMSLNYKNACVQSVVD